MQGCSSHEGHYLRDVAHLQHAYPRCVPRGALGCSLCGWGGPQGVLTSGVLVAGRPRYISCPPWPEGPLTSAIPLRCRLGVEEAWTWGSGGSGGEARRKAVTDMVTRYAMHVIAQNNA